MSEVHAYFEKANRSFEVTEALLASGYADFATSRAYYGCFYVAEALLSDEGMDVSTHAGVIGEYGRLFARTRRVNPRFHRLLNRSFRARQSADYDTDFDLDDAEVREMIGVMARGRAARRYLELKHAEDDAEQE